MLLRNTREPFDEKEFDELTETGANWIEHYKLHGYEAAGEYSLVDVSKSGDEVTRLITVRRGKKEAEQPPSDLGQLADDISKDEGTNE